MQDNTDQQIYLLLFVALPLVRIKSFLRGNFIMFLSIILQIKDMDGLLSRGQRH